MIGLTSTRSQDGTQTGWLTQIGQTNGVFATMWSRARCRVGEWMRGGESQLGSALGIERWELLYVFPLVLYILLTRIIVVIVHSLCCSVKLPSSRSMSFASFFPFSSPPQQGRGNRATTQSFAAGPNHNPSPQSGTAMLYMLEQGYKSGLVIKDCLCNCSSQEVNW